MSPLPRSPYLYALASGVLLGLAFPQTLSNGGYLSFIAWVPLLLALVDVGGSVSRRSLIGWFYVTFVAYHGISNWWVCSWQDKTDPYLFASGIALWLFHPFFLMMPAVALASIRRRLGVLWMLACTPLAIAGFEWLHGQTDASYPWLTTGYSLIHTPFAQVADTVGVYGLSLFIGVVNALIVAIVLLRRSKQQVKIHVAVLIAGLVVWLGIGLAKQASWSSPDTSDTLEVVVVQPNEDPWDKWGDTREQVGVHRELVDRSRVASGSADLYVWSETAIPYTIRDTRFLPEWNDLKNWVDSSRISLLTGYADMMVYGVGEAPPSARQSKADAEVRFDIFNAAMIINASQPNVGVHRKTMLTPFAERLPFADQLTFAMSWIEWGVGISAWGKGRTREPLMVMRGNDTLARVGTIICIESIYPEVARDLVNHGADVLCVITNDAWYNGTWGPEQHFDIARMRAIEQRRPVLRCANSGVSGFITPDGSDSPHPAIAPMTTATARSTVHPVQERSTYALVGDPLPIAGLVISLLALCCARISPVLRNLPFRSTSLEQTTL